MAALSANVDASCAICGAPPYPECPHEAQRLQIALEQAQARWDGMQQIREWVLDHARNAVIATFHQLKSARWEQHITYLQTLPCYTLYHRFQGNPPLPPTQLHQLHTQIGRANEMFKTGVDEDWRRSCLEYPRVLDYYFSLVEVDFPEERDTRVREPRFGVALKDAKRVRPRKESIDLGSTKERRKKDRRRSRGRTPPAAPMPYR